MKNVSLAPPLWLSLYSLCKRQCTSLQSWNVRACILPMSCKSFSFIRWRWLSIASSHSSLFIVDKVLTKFIKSPRILLRTILTSFARTPGLGGCCFPSSRQNSSKLKFSAFALLLPTPEPRQNFAKSKLTSSIFQLFSNRVVVVRELKAFWELFFSIRYHSLVAVLFWIKIISFPFLARCFDIVRPGEGERESTPKN